MCPHFLSCVESSLVLLHVHFNGDIGSPRVVGSTSPSNAFNTLGSLSLTVLRPPPIRLCRPSGGASPSRNSRIPFRIVRSEIPVAMATAAIPPRPNDSASTADQRRRPRSLRSPMRLLYFD